MSYTATFFSGVDSSGHVGLWRTNGTAAGTKEIRRLYGAPNVPYDDFTLVGGKVLFTGEGPGGGKDLWITDGTAGGTRQIAPVSASKAFNTVSDVASLGSKAVFNALDAHGLYALWVTNGTGAGTSEIAKTAGINPHGMTAFKGKVYFGALNGGGLWSTNGTAGGTVEIAGTATLSPEELTICNGKLYFIDAKTGALWVSDGTVKGTHGLLNGLGSAIDLTAVGKQLYFDLEDPNGNFDLYRTDGTAHGTVALGIGIFNNLNGNAGPVSPDLTVYKNRVYFEADSSIANYATSVWVSNGTVAGTHEIAPIRNAATYGVLPTPDDPDYNGPGFAVIDNLLVFDGAAPGGLAPDWGETGLWVTNGTASGTHELTGIKNAGYTGVLGFIPSNMTTITLPQAPGTPTPDASAVKAAGAGPHAGIGTERIVAGPGDDTFDFAAARFGREVIMKADLAHDSFDMGGVARSVADLRFGTGHIGGVDYAVITGDLGLSADRVLVQGWSGADLLSSGHFQFGG